MMVAGACGYVVKGGEALKVVETIRAAYLGQRPMDPAIMPQLVDSVISLAQAEKQRRQELEAAKREIESSHEQSVLALAQALKSRDGETGSHVDRVVEFSLRVGRHMGLSEEQLEDLRYGALFHDIGKIGIADSILLGTGELSEEQREVINTHTLVGERILQPVPWLRNAAAIVRSHHENWDGSGYPDGISGRDIPLGARIIRVCDTFDAMTSGRRYQDAMDKDEAIAKIDSMAGTQFDPAVVLALQAVHEKERL
jgi:HD-GYP domain-containing protein (c-di-GMP phosphodiesterase class II)